MPLVSYSKVKGPFKAFCDLKSFLLVKITVESLGFAQMHFI